MMPTTINDMTTSTKVKAAPELPIQRPALLCPHDRISLCIGSPGKNLKYWERPRVGRVRVSLRADISISLIPSRQRVFLEDLRNEWCMVGGRSGAPWQFHRKGTRSAI